MIPNLHRPGGDFPFLLVQPLSAGYGGANIERIKPAQKTLYVFSDIDSAVLRAEKVYIQLANTTDPIFLGLFGGHPTLMEEFGVLDMIIEGLTGI